MALDRRFMDELRDRLTLSDVIGRSVPLKKAGREYKACCPFHKENTPSFTVNDDKQFYHCFGCGAHGDVIGFKMRYNNLSFMDAIESLAAEAGIEVPKPTQEQKQEFDRHKQLYNLLDDVTNWFQSQLQESANGYAKRYLLERGLSEDAIEKFRIGFAPNSWDELRNVIKRHGHSVKDAVELGLLKGSNRADKEPYAFFRGRIIFPVTDRRGRAVAFGGRHLEAAFKDGELDHKPAKYLNSPDHKLFHKGQLLFSMARARQAAAHEKDIILVEGYMDVIALVQAGFWGAVAPLGTAVTEDQISLLWRMSRNDSTPFLCFDGDNAGRSAALRAMDRALPYLEPDKTLKFIFMPSGEDPDTLIRSQGAKAFSDLKDGALTVFDMIWETQTAGRKFDTPEARAGLKKRLEESVAKINHGELRSIYTRMLRDRFYQTFKGQKTGKKGTYQGRATQKMESRVRPIVSDRELLRQKILLAALINHPTFVSEFSEILGKISFDTKELRELAHTLLYDDWNPTEIKEYLSNKGFDATLRDLLGNSVLMHAHFAKEGAEPNQALNGIQDVIHHIERERVEHDIEQLRAKMGKNPTDNDFKKLTAMQEQLKRYSTDAH